MQTKKDEVRNRILQAGQKEFYDKGFEKSSIRRIVKSASTTIGNFYNYFDSKESLFYALVDDVYEDFIGLIKNHHSQEMEIDVFNHDITFLKEYLNEVFKLLIPKLNNRVLLLLTRSQGTKYENAKNDIGKLVYQHFLSHIKKFSPNYHHPEIGDFLAKQFVDGLLDILENVEDENKRTELIIEQILFFSFGVMGILGVKQ